MSSARVGGYRYKSVSVEAIRFTGWNNAEEIWRWAAWRNVFYVPDGYEHALRRDNERDGSTHHILEDAEGFLVVMTDPNEYKRVDVGDWIVGTNLGEPLYVYTEKEFQEKFEENS